MAIYMQTLGAQMGAPPPPTLYVPPAPGGPSLVSFTSLNHAISTFVDVDVIVVACHRAAGVVGHRATVVAALCVDAFLVGLGNLPMQGRSYQNFHLKLLCIFLISSI